MIESKNDIFEPFWQFTLEPLISKFVLSFQSHSLSKSADKQNSIHDTFAILNNSVQS